MAISKGSSTGRETCCFTLAVERYDAQAMECIVYEGDREQGICCRSFTELACQLERGCEEMDYPTPTVQKREFLAAVKDRGYEADDQAVSGRKDGRLATLRVRIKQCFHATWQGQVEMDGKGQDGVLFSSFLEFVMILDEMLTGNRCVLRMEGGSLADDLANALLLAGRYSGIWVGERESAEVLICGRTLKDGGKEIFAVRPIFRENHTYQGSVSWMGGRQQKNFRSLLELLCLMMSAAGKQAQKEDGI